MSSVQRENTKAFITAQKMWSVVTKQVRHRVGRKILTLLLKLSDPCHHPK